MELENIKAYFNFNDTIHIISNFLLLILIYGFFETFRDILKWYKSRQKRPPGPTGLFFAGYFPFLGKEPHKSLWNMRKKYGNIIGIFVGPKYTVVLNDFKVAKEVLSHPGALDRETNLTSHIDHVGFFAENGTRWNEQRRFTMLTAKNLGLGNSYWGSLIIEELSSLVHKLQELKGMPIDISEYLSYSLNNSILSLLIGRRLGDDEIDKIRLSSEYSEVVMTKLGVTNPTSVVPGLRKFCEIFKIAGHDEAKNVIRKFSLFIKEEIELHKTSNLYRDIPDFINSYLEKIKEMSKIKNTDHAFSEAMLEGNFVSLFVGSSDTIYSSLGWLIRLMCKYPDIQEKVHAELVKTLGKEQATYEERDRIPYTFAVLMESQRIASNVPLSSTRRANQDIHFKGYVIPKGSDITANLWGLHHDPAYWDEPEEFRPERFLTDEGTKLIQNPPSFAPFSLGRRNCPGERIAWVTLLHYFSEILKAFKVSTPPGVEPEFKVIRGIITRLAPQPLCFKPRYV